MLPGPGFADGGSLLGVRKGLAVEHVVDRLGEPAAVLRLSGDLRRAYLYPRFNAVFILERGAVVSFGIYDADAGTPFAEAEVETGAASLP